MKANPDKCQALAIGKKSMNTNIVFDLAGNKIKCCTIIIIINKS
jgi:transcription antitermination factor NusA-like protein